MSNALFAVLVAAVLVLLWFLRRAALSGRERAKHDQPHSHQAPRREVPISQPPSPPTPGDGASSSLSSLSSTDAHPESVTREATSANGCGTIGPVTPMPARVDGDEVHGPRRDSRLAEAVDIARAAADEEAAAGNDPIGSPALDSPAADGDAVGDYAGVQSESDFAATHFFESRYPGYVGWRWAVTVASAGPQYPVTVSEVVLLPGRDALTAPEWVPWSDRIRPGDLGAGDLLPSDQDDLRLAPNELPGDDPATDELVHESGLGRSRVLSREGRLDAAHRWYAGDFGPETETARLAPGPCGTCGFLLPLAGSMRAAFGVCGNAVAPADGRVVHVEFGCGAHSEAEIDTSSTVPVADVVYDDTTLDYESRG